MITRCPDCGQQVKVGAPGKYRCPMCKSIFEHEHIEGEQEEFDPVESPDEEIYIEVPQFESQIPESDAEDLYISDDEVETACESCGRPGAQGVCPTCGEFLCNVCASREEPQGVCPNCFKKAEETPLPAHGQEPPATGFMDLFVPRFKAVLFKPAEFFSSPPASEAPSHPYLFAVICYCVGGLFLVAYNIILQRSLVDALEGLNLGLFSSLGLESMMAMDPGSVFLEAGLFLPVQAVFMLFFTAGIIHLFLLMFGRPVLGFAGTLRVVAYSNATHIFLVVPVVGSLVAFFWQMFILIVGISRTHNMTPNRAGVAVLLPFGLFILFAIFAVILVATFAPALLNAVGM
jgi:hypothetical protein